MSDDNYKPVALLIYANTGQELAWLKEECDTIAAHLKASKLCDVETIAAATLPDVVTRITDPDLRDRVVIVHYAGHANGRGLQLNDQQGQAEGELAHIRGLAGVLKTQSNLRVLFINGCNSREQVLELTEAGIPLVIATRQGIDDKVARDFADRFYTTLKQERSIADAFQVAADTIQASVGETTRGLYFGHFQQSTSAEKNELPWQIHGPEVDRHWKLSDPHYRGIGPKWDHNKYSLNRDSPYLGLRYFAEEDNDRFFGRDDFVERLLTSSDAAPLLFVVGASGTGKSSVVRAGMVPAWKARHQDPGPPRVFVLTPEDDPFDQLSISLARVETFDREKLREVRKNISPNALQAAIDAFGQGEPWLIFIDQFEQIFTRTTDAKKRDAFVASVVNVAKANHPNICLVLAMRDDFFPQLRQYPDLFPITDKHLERVAALDRKALREVIERPAAEHGVMFEPGLVDDMVEAIEGQPGALPLLQYTLNALWQNDDLSDRSLNRSTYEKLGGVSGALGRRFQMLYDQLDDEGKNEFRWMMLKLVAYEEGPGGTAVVSQLTPKSEFEGRQVELLDLLITKEKLLVSSGTETPAVQLGHEKIIDAWPELSRWTQVYREANSVRQQLRKAARVWRRLKGERANTSFSLWQGSQLVRALELRKAGDFDRLGGLDRDTNQFLNVSHSRSRRLTRALGISLGAAIAAIVCAGVFLGMAIVRNEQLVFSNTELRDRLTTITLNAADAAIGDWDLSGSPESLWRLFKAYRASRQTGDEQLVRGCLSLLASWADEIGTPLVPTEGQSWTRLEYRNDGGILLCVQEGYGAQLWDLEHNQPLGPFLKHYSMEEARFDPSGNRLLTYGARNLENVDVGVAVAVAVEKTVKVWDVRSSTLIVELKSDAFPHVSPDGLSLFAVTSSYGQLWSMTSGTRIGSRIEHNDQIDPGDPFSGSMLETSAVMEGQFSNSGRGLLTYGSSVDVRLWDQETGQELSESPLRHPRRVSRARFGDSGDYIATLCVDGQVRLWSVKKGELLLAPLKIDGRLQEVYFGQNDTRLVVIYQPDEVEYGYDARVFNVKNGEAVGLPVEIDRRSNIHWRSVSCPDGLKVLHRGEEEATLVELHSGKPLGPRFECSNSFFVPLFRQDGKRLLTPDARGGGATLRTATGRPVGYISHEGGWIRAVDTASNGEWFITGADDGAGRVWDWEFGSAVGHPMRHTAGVACVDVSPRDDTIVTCSDGVGWLWAASRAIGATMHPHVRDVQFGVDGTRCVTFSGRTLRLWNSETGQAIGKEMSHDTSFRVSPVEPFGSHGVHLITVNGAVAKVWDGKTGQQVGSDIRYSSSIETAAWDAAGTMVAFGCRDGTVEVRRAEENHSIGTSIDFGTLVNSVSFSPEGTSLLIGGVGYAQIYDWQQGTPAGEKMVHETRDDTRGVYVVASFSPDGARVLTRDLDRHTVNLWNRETRARVGGVIECDDERTDIDGAVAQFTPDGRYLITTSYSEGNVRFWNSDTGAIAGEPLKHPQVLSSLLSPDGNGVLSIGWEGLRRWDIDTREPIWDTEMRVKSTAGKSERGVFDYRVMFNSLGTRVMTVADNRATTWEARSGLPLGQSRPAEFGRFFPDGRRAVVGTQAGDNFLDGNVVSVSWDLPDNPEFVEAFTTVRTGLKVLAYGQLERINYREWNAVRQRLVREQGSSSLGGDP